MVRGRKDLDSNPVLLFVKSLTGDKEKTGYKDYSKQQEHLAWVGQLFFTVTQGRGKLCPFVQWADKTVVRADKKKIIVKVQESSGGGSSGID